LLGCRVQLAAGSKNNLMSLISPYRAARRILHLRRKEDRASLLLIAFLSALALVALALGFPSARAQAPATPPVQTPDQTSDQSGPNVDSGPIVIPKKKESDEPPPPPAP